MSNIRHTFRRAVVHPLTLLIFVVVGAVIALYLSHVVDSIPVFDAYVLSFIATVFAGAALFMIANTKWAAWTIISAGLLATFFGDSLLYGASAVNQFYNADNPPTQRETFPYYELILLVVRALFIVGGLWVLTGLIQDTWHTWSDERKARIKNVLTFSWLRRSIRRTRYGRNS